MPASLATPSLRIKLSALAGCALAGLALIGFVAVYFPASELRMLDDALAARAESYARMVALQAGPVVAFSDRESARELFDGVATDPAVVRVALFHEDGRLILARGEGAVVRPRDSARLAVLRLPDRVRVESPVVSAEGPRGMLVLEVSRGEVVLRARATRRASWVVAALAMLIGLALGWTLVTAYGLARAVQRRTAELAARNVDMQRVLENVGQGFLTLDRAGRVASERSAIVARWFGELPAGTTFWEALAPLDVRASEWFEVGWETLFDDALPLELVISQLPKRVSSGAVQLGLSYKPLTEGAALVGLLVVATDVSVEVERERVEADQRVLMDVFKRVLADRTAFVEFVAEVDALVERATGEPALEWNECFRVWHTLKGNFGLQDLPALATLCHGVEARMTADRAPPGDADRRALASGWAALKSSIATLLDIRPSRRVDVALEEHAELLAALQNGAPRAQIVATLRAWSDEPVERRLMRVAEQARALALRLGKPAPDVVIVSDGVRVPREDWSPLWSAFTHAVRNAVDHGLEPAAEREARGKPAMGRLRLSARRVGREVEIALHDDGRGIDWDAVAARARDVGLASDTREALVEALFASEFSTRTAVSETSGRGVGMGALREAVRAFGGRVEVQSGSDGGTTVRIRVPQAAQSAATAPRRSERPRLVS